MKNWMFTLLGLVLSLTLGAQDETYTRQSVLSDGEVYKIAVSETGIYRLSFTFLTETLGLDMSNLDPRNLRLYGNGGGILPQTIAATRIDDLEENAIQVVGEEDGQFDASDYILFYAQGASRMYFDTDKELFRMEQNVYATENYYFLKLDTERGLRIQTAPDVNNTNYTTRSFDAYMHFEEDRMNLLDLFESTQGTGRDWYGDQFKNITEHSYSFDFPNMEEAAMVQAEVRLVARHPASTKFQLETNGQRFESSLIRSARGSYDRPSENTYAQPGVLNVNFQANSSTIPLSVIYTGENAWLDYIVLNTRSSLTLGNKQLHFRDLETAGNTHSTFELSAASQAVRIWNVTNPMDVQTQSTTEQGGVLRFGAATTDLQEFVAFELDQVLEPMGGTRIANQNLHGMTTSNMVVVFPSIFGEQVMQFAEHRSRYSNLVVDTVNIEQVYNEFSSGRQDPTAIRDFARMLYLRNPDFDYLLLFGDGSFDYRNIKNIAAAENSNFIPVYETEASLSPTRGFPSDDYYALLDDAEGINLRGDLDIAVGRLPVKTVEEAQGVVDKIINYDTNPNTLGDWRNRMVFLADDEDNNIHLRDTDAVAKGAKSEYPLYNQEKIYFDAFPQVSASGGEGFPQATEALNQAIFRGAIAVNYLGHGGSKGWAQERVLDRDRGDIRNWSNTDKLPVFVTATCSFAGYDDPNQVTAGERVLLNPDGGGIALFTTVRAVYASSNKQLVDAVFDTMFQKVDQRRQTLGQIMQAAKNISKALSENTRKFTLLGDPSQPLALPKYNVTTTAINEKPITEQIDTLRALQRVTIEGQVETEFGQLASDFNGELLATIFDKQVTYKTLGQDPKSQVIDFQLQKNVIFKGRASVNNGNFRLTFVVPKDINFEFGAGRISYYAKDVNTMTDASGYFDEVIIGGTDNTVLADNTGPEIEVFMNAEEFVFGGITDEEPILLVKLQDENGINVSGNSIGHDLEGVVDEDTQNTYLLNDFYESALDDYTKGEVRFPLSKLPEGRHQVRVRAWDIANNSSEGYTEFVVASSGELALKHILNYPNPFVDATCFQFEHNLAGQELDIQVQVFTISGRLVKTLEKRIFTDGFLVAGADCIEWDGKDDYGQQLAKGIYLYRLQVGASIDATVKKTTKFEKLVILK